MQILPNGKGRNSSSAPQLRKMIVCAAERVSDTENGRPERIRRWLKISPPSRFDSAIILFIEHKGHSVSSAILWRSYENIDPGAGARRLWPQCAGQGRRAGLHPRCLL